MVYFAKKNQVPSPYSILQHVERIAKRNLGSGNYLRCLPTIAMIGGGGSWSQNLQKVSSKKVNEKLELGKNQVYSFWFNSNSC